MLDSETNYQAAAAADKLWMNSEKTMGKEFRKHWIKIPEEIVLGEQKSDNVANKMNWETFQGKSMYGNKHLPQ